MEGGGGIASSVERFGGMQTGADRVCVGEAGFDVVHD